MPSHRNYVFTFNNYPDTTLVDNLVCKYIAYSKEVAPTTGTPHLQGFVSFNTAKSEDQAKKLMPGCWVQAMIGSIAQNDVYCSKVATMTERGEKPISNDNKGRAEKLRWQRARDLAKEGNLDEIDADIFLRCYSTLKRIKHDYRTKPSPVSVRAYWIFGPTGTGKSHAVETAFPSCYKKSMDDLKWFDGYQGEECVYLEDIDKYQVKWGGITSLIKDFLNDLLINGQCRLQLKDLWNTFVRPSLLSRRTIELKKFGTTSVRLNPYFEDFKW